MPEERINLDAQQYLASMERMIATMNRYNQVVRESLNQMGRVTKAFRGQKSSTSNASKELRNHDKEVKDAAAAQQRLAASAQVTTQNMRRQGLTVFGVTLSWKELSKLVLARVVTLMFHRLQLALRQSVSDMEQLNVKILELQTIADDLAQEGASGIERMARETRNLSNEFAMARLDIVTAQYQAISSAMGDGVDEVRSFIRQNIEFSKVTATTLANSVDLTSAVISSFRLSLLETNRVMTILFGTIREGRLTAAEFANTLGRVTAIAEAANVSFEETMATLAIMTRSGVRVNEAMTALNATIEQFIRPSQAMQDLMREWGVSSGELAIETFGLTGVFEKFADIIERDGVRAIGSVVTQQRALRGILLAMNPELQEMVDHFNELDAEAENYAQVVERRLNAPTQRFQEEMTRVGNMFDSFGDGIIRLVGRINFFGATFSDLIAMLGPTGALIAATALTKAFTRLSIVTDAMAVTNLGLRKSIAAVTTKFMAQSSAMQVATWSARALNVALATLKLTIGFVAIGITALFTFWAIRSRQQQAEEMRLNQLMQERIELQEKILANEIRTRRVVSEAESQRVLQDYANILSDMNEDLEDARITWLETERDIKNNRKQLEQLNEASRQNLKTLEGWKSEWESIRDTAQETAETVLEDFVSARFERQIQTIDSVFEQMEIRAQAAGHHLARAHQAFQVQDFDRMRDSFSDARRQLEQVSREAFRIGDRDRFMAAEVGFEQLAAAQIQMEQQIQAEAEQQLALIDQEIAQEEELVRLRENQIEIEQATLELYKERLQIVQDETLTERERAWHLARINERAWEISNAKEHDVKRTLQLNEQLRDQLELTEQIASVERARDEAREVFTRREQILNQAHQRQSELQSQIGDTLESQIIPLTSDLNSLIEQLTRRQYGNYIAIRETATGLEQQRREYKEISQELENQIELANEQREEIGRVEEDTQQAIFESLQRFREIEDLPEEIMERVVAAHERIKAQLVEQEIIQEEIATANESVVDAQREYLTIEKQGIDALRQEALTHEEINQLLEQSRERVQERFEVSLPSLQTQKELEEEIEGILQRSSEAEITALEGRLRLTEQITNQLRTQQDLIPQSGLGTGQIQGFAKGGTVADNIPAMLRRGEEVINSESAAAFRSVLKEMNVSNTQMPRSQPRELAGASSPTLKYSNTFNLQSSDSQQMDVHRMSYQLKRQQQRGLRN